MNIGQKIKELRKEKKLSQAELAGLLDITNQTISAYELNSVFPPIEKLLKISEIFNVPIGVFFGSDTIVKEDNTFLKEQVSVLSKQLSLATDKEMMMLATIKNLSENFRCGNNHGITWLTVAHKNVELPITSEVISSGASDMKLSA